MNIRQAIEWVQRWAGVVALVVGAVWGLYRWSLAGGSDWMVNLDMTTEVLPYSDTARLLVVHVKSKNPTANKVEFKRADSSFTLSARLLPVGLTASCKVDFEKGELLLQPIDLMTGVGEGYVFMPSAEFDDMQTLVVTAGSNVYLSAELMRKDGPRQSGEFVSVDRVVRAVDK